MIKPKIDDLARITPMVPRVEGKLDAVLARSLEQASRQIR